MAEERNLGNPIEIALSNGVVFHRAEERIREYCEIEVYRDKNFKGGYDDHHDVTDSVTNDDLEAANNLYANMDSRDRMRILGSPEIPLRLAAVRDLEIGKVKDEEWEDIRTPVRALLSSFLSIPNVKIAKTMKVLHLKRPHLFPVLDSFVVKFLTGNDMARNPFSEEELLQIGMTCLDVAHKDLIKNQAAFAELQSRLADLPALLTPVRMYSILCWTQEKWVNLGNISAKYGKASWSLEQRAHPTVATPIHALSPSVGPANSLARPPPPGEITTIKEFRQIKLRAEGVIINTASSPPRAHRSLCRELTEERFQDTVVFNEGKGGRYYLRNNLAEAVRDFEAVACRKCRPERPVLPG
jgi:hypothetical protein